MEAKMDKKFFGNLIHGLFTNYRQKVDDKLIDLFWIEFKNVSEDRFRHAIKDVIEIEDYFPTIATIKKYLTVTVTDQDWEWPTSEDFKKAGESTQIGRDCLRIILLLDNKLTRKEYYDEMLKLDVKYPNIKEWVHDKEIDRSFKTQAEMYLHKKRDKVLYQDPGLAERLQKSKRQ